MNFNSPRLYITKKFLFACHLYKNMPSNVNHIIHEPIRPWSFQSLQILTFLSSVITPCDQIHRLRMAFWSHCWEIWLFMIWCGFIKCSAVHELVGWVSSRGICWRWPHVYRGQRMTVDVFHKMAGMQDSWKCLTFCSRSKDIWENAIKDNETLESFLYNVLVFKRK